LDNNTAFIYFLA